MYRDKKLEVHHSCQRIKIAFNPIPKHIDVFVPCFFYKSEELRRAGNWAIVFPITHEQPFPIPHYRVDFTSLATAGECRRTETCFAHKSRTKLPAYFRDQVRNIVSTTHQRFSRRKWFTDACATCYMLILKLLLPRTEK
jgi:hypothetical protein